MSAVAKKAKGGEVLFGFHIVVLYQRPPGKKPKARTQGRHHGRMLLPRLPPRLMFS